jgi:glycerol-3-phosphate dehydrogenase (NAD(P)+)
MTFGILGSGSWGTAIAKILTDNLPSEQAAVNPVYWWNRSEKSIQQMMTRHHNPHYLSMVYFDTAKLKLTADLNEVITHSDCIIIAIPSAYVAATLLTLDKNIFEGKKIVSAVKGILPDQNLLLNDFLNNEFYFPIENYFAVLGPCHAEEVASEKLSYLTFSGVDEITNHEIATHFKTSYINIIENNDIYGVQFAAVLKNIYAVGAGIAHGLDYGDNFLSVLIANSADEMAGFLKKSGVQNLEVGSIDHSKVSINSNGPIAAAGEDYLRRLKFKTTNYAASVYLGDLLVTCYSLYSRNRTFGNMIGKGYSVKSAQMEMSMVAEGYNASKCMYIINQSVKADMPIAETIYQMLWENLSPQEGFNRIEQSLI